MFLILFDRVKLFPFSRCQAGVHRWTRFVSTKKAEKSSAHPEVLKFLGSFGFKNEIPNLSPKFLEKRRIDADALCLIDSKAALEIVNLIRNDLDNGSPVFECNPGFCFISNELIKAGFSDVRLFETDGYFKLKAHDLQRRFPDRVRVYYSNIIHLWKTTFKDAIENGKFFRNIMKEVKINPWDGPPIINFIGATPNSSFIRDLVYSVVFKSGFLSYGRPDFFLLLSPGIFLVTRDCFKPNHFYRKPHTVLLSLLFDIHHYGKFDRKFFLPWRTEKKRTSYESLGIESDKMYLVRLSPKKDIQSILPDHLLKPFWFFLKHHMVNKQGRILPMMEEWIPGCGPRLIAMGFQVYTPISEIPSEKLLSLFLEFNKWPEFESCPFLPAMENFLLKMESPGVDIEPSETLDSVEISDEV